MRRKQYQLDRSFPYFNFHNMGCRNRRSLLSGLDLSVWYRRAARVSPRSKPWYAAYAMNCYVILLTLCSLRSSSSLSAIGNPQFCWTEVLAFLRKTGIHTPLGTHPDIRNDTRPIGNVASPSPELREQVGRPAGWQPTRQNYNVLLSLRGTSPSVLQRSTKHWGSQGIKDRATESEAKSCYI